MKQDALEKRIGFWLNTKQVEDVPFQVNYQPSEKAILNRKFLYVK